MKPTVLALDLEGTLISNAVSQIPRPGLLGFLTEVKALFPRVVMFTTVPEARFRSIAALLTNEGNAPPWFPSMEYVDWRGDTKDLNQIPNASAANALLIDDREAYVHPGQDAQWIEVEQFASPYDDADSELSNVLARLHERLQPLDALFSPNAKLERAMERARATPPSPEMTADLMGFFAEARDANAKLAKAAADLGAWIAEVNPMLTAEARKMGWSDQQLGAWMLNGDRWSSENAALIASGSADVVVEKLRRIHYGFTA